MFQYNSNSLTQHATPTRISPSPYPEVTIDVKGSSPSYSGQRERETVKHNLKLRQRIASHCVDTATATGVGASDKYFERERERERGFQLGHHHCLTSAPF